MGQTLDLDGGDPFMGRTSTSGLSSSWTLPGGATVTDLVIQALAPADPTVSLKPLSFEPKASAVHPDDGRLWLAVGDDVMVIDAAMSPPTIDILPSPVGTVIDVAVDMTHRELVVLGDDGLAMIDFDNGSIQAYSQQTTPAGLRGLAANASGDVHVVAADCLYTRLPGDAAGWSKLAGCNANTFPITATAEVLTMEIFGQYVYVSMADEGVIRYDTASSQSYV